MTLHPKMRSLNGRQYSVTALTEIFTLLFKTNPNTNYRSA